MIRLFSLAAVAVLTVGTAVASAAPITFSGLDNPRGTLTNSLLAETQFKAALSVFGTETVDAFVSPTNNPTLVFGATGVTATTSNTQALSAGSFAVSSPNYLVSVTGDDVFTFSQAVNGFGTFLLSLGTNTVATTLTFTLENTVLATSQSVNTATFGPNFGDTMVYFGVFDAASPFNRVTVHTSNENDVFEYDNLTAGLASATPVPEPGSLALFVTGAVGLLARRRERR
jgi:hypothetical protein